MVIYVTEIEFKNQKTAQLTNTENPAKKSKLTQTVPSDLSPHHKHALEPRLAQNEERTKSFEDVCDKR